MTNRLSYALKADGTLPEGWGWSTLGDVANVIAGNPAPQGQEYFAGGKYPFVRVQDMGRLGGATKLSVTNDKINDEAIKKLRLFPEGSVLFTKSGASTLLNQRAILAFDAYVVSHIAAAIPKDDVMSKWLYYWMRTVDFAYLAHATTLPSLPLSKAKTIPIPVAPLDQQKSIVAEIEKQFSRLDEAVANLKRVKANLKRYKAAVLKAAVEGRLVETEAELARQKTPSPLAGEGGGEGATYETGAQLLQRILETRRSQWRSKGKYKEPAPPDTIDLPELPEGWVWATVEMIADAIGGYAFSSKTFASSGYQVVKMANVRMGCIDLTQRPSFVSEVDDDIRQKYGLVDGDVLITLTGTRRERDYGYVAVVRSPQRLLLNQRIARLRPEAGIDPEFLALTLQSESYRNRFFARETGNVGQGNVGMAAVTIEAVPLAPQLEQLRIVAEVDRRLSLVGETESQVEANLKRAERLRQSLLRRAFSGHSVNDTSIQPKGGIHVDQTR